MKIAHALVIALVLVPVALAADTPSPAAPPEPADMKPLFNGKDLAGWEGDPRLWSAKDGFIRGETTAENPTKGNTFLLYRGGEGMPPAELKDFELRLSFRIERGNSGVQYRSKHLPPKEGEQNKWVVSGYQAEVANSPGKAGFLYHEKGRGSLNQVSEKVEVGEDGKPKVVGQLGNRNAIAATYKKTDWNDFVIICEGNHVRHYLNGVQTVDLIDNDPKGRLMSGILALQIHAGPPMWVEFKNLRIKHLDSKP